MPLEATQPSQPLAEVIPEVTQEPEPEAELEHEPTREFEPGPEPEPTLELEPEPISQEPEHSEAAPDNGPAVEEQPAAEVAANETEVPAEG